VNEDLVSRIGGEYRRRGQPGTSRIPEGSGRPGGIFGLNRVAARQSVLRRRNGFVAVSATTKADFATLYFKCGKKVNEPSF
jgi:hypothetical protein